MSTIVSIKQRIEQLDAGSFQILCDEYLSKEGYLNIVSLGTKAGTQKTTKGTPDTYSCNANGKYVLAEYTTQRSDLEKKIRSDIEKCFDTNYTGLGVDDIAEIIYCHTSSNISAGFDKEIKEYCKEKGVLLKLIGIDKLANDIRYTYPILAKEHLGLTIDTEQIQDPSDYIKHYDSNELAAPLSTAFQFREDDIKKIEDAFAEQDVVILTGAAGTGKTRLALEFADRYIKEHDSSIYVIHNNGQSIIEDLKLYFEHPGNYFIVVDDANQISQLNYIIDYVNKKSLGYNCKILITVRNYAIKKVKSDISNTARFAEVTLNTFSNEEIKALIKEIFDINNQDYLKRIATISEGNARIAVLAGKIALDGDRLSSISDATELYANYYGKAFEEASLENNQQLQAVAGVIAFLGSIHLDHLDPVLPLISKQDVDLARFIECTHKLHELELVDIYQDKAVIISDQCFANYILKRVYIDKKTISLAEMLDACFNSFRDRTVQALNTLLGVFHSKDVIDFTENEIKAVWKKRKNRSQHDFWEWVKAFYLVNKTEALLLVKEIIEQAEQSSITPSDIDINRNKNYVNIDDELLNILGGFADTSDVDIALDLLFTYYLKRPDMYIQFYHTINTYYGINNNSYKTGYYSQIHLVNSFINSSDSWENPYMRILFLDISRELLKVFFSNSESESRGKTFTFYSFPLPLSEGVVEYRKLIWEQLLILQKNNDSKEFLYSILDNYAQSLEECSYDIIKEDAPYICELIGYVLSPDKVADCIVAENIDSVFQRVSYESDYLKPFLCSDKLQGYHLLIGPKRDYDAEYEDSNKDRIIGNYFEETDDRLRSFDELLDITKECSNNNVSQLWYVEEGFSRVINFFSQNKDEYVEIIKKTIKSGFLQGINEFSIVSDLFSFLSIEDVKQIIIENAPEETIDCWLFAFYSEFPEDKINISITEELYEYLKCTYDQKITRYNNRSLQFLKKYEKTDTNVISKSAELIFEKRHYSTTIVNIYYCLLFNKYLWDPKELISSFSNNMKLLEDIYIFESLYDRSTDYDGSFIRELCNNRKEFAKDFVFILETEEHNWHDENRLCALYDCPEYIEIIDLVFNGLRDDFHSIYSSHQLMECLINVPVKYLEKSDNWIKHYISENCKDAKKLICLFDVISELPDDRKINYVQYLVELNDDPELFREIPLTLRSCIWSGSVIPIYLGWINYLKRLRPIFSEIKFLEHMQIIEENIEYYEERIKEAEINEVLRG